LQDASDLVSIEVATALSGGASVIPVLVGNATMPRQVELPETLAALVHRNAFEVSDKLFDHTMNHLARYLREEGTTSGSPASGQPVHIAEDFHVGRPGRPKKKVCLLGAAGVGKTSLIRRFVSSMFTDSYVTTVGVKIDKKTVRVGGSEVMLIIWDMAGEEEGQPLKLNQVRDASGYIFVADGCDARTLERAMKLQHRVSDEVGPRPTVIAINKVDLYDEWEVAIEALESYTRGGMTVFTTSAKTGKGVEQMFTYLARQVIALDDERLSPEDD